MLKTTLQTGAKPSLRFGSDVQCAGVLFLCLHSCAPRVSKRNKSDAPLLPAQRGSQTLLYSLHRWWGVDGGRTSSQWHRPMLAGKISFLFCCCLAGSQWHCPMLVERQNSSLVPLIKRNTYGQRNILMENKMVPWCPLQGETHMPRDI